MLLCKRSLAVGFRSGRWYLPQGFFPVAVQGRRYALDATILDTQNDLAAELETIAERAARPAMTCPATPHTPVMLNFRPLPHICFSIVSVDFDAIPDASCREAFWRLPASWTLKESAVTALVQLPLLLLGRSCELKDFQTNTGAPLIPSFPSDFSDICAAVASAYPN